VSLPKQIPDFATAIGTVNKETNTVTISTAWYQFLMRQYLDTIGTGIGTAEADLLATSDIELINNLGAHGYTGSATATFTATNKPGSNAGVVGWIPVDMDGIIRFIAVWG
jgi:xanthine/uracil/vitamin C permease (AzgA family)